MDDDEFDLVTPFWIDTDGYTDRDRLLFCCGVEFQMIREELKTGDAIDRPIHTENESRVRMLMAREKREALIERLDDSWSRLFCQEL